MDYEKSSHIYIHVVKEGEIASLPLYIVGFMNCHSGPFIWFWEKVTTQIATCGSFKKLYEYRENIQLNSITFTYLHFKTFHSFYTLKKISEL